MAANRKLILGLVIGGFVFLFLIFFIIGLVGMFSSGEEITWAGFGDKIAIVEIKGEITESENIIRLLYRFAEDNSVQGILLRIDSPGGAVSPSQEIHDEILKIRADYGKPMVASLGTVAASGGYYIACACDYIFANPGTLTGSIGVIMQYPVVSELIDKIGIQYQTIKSGAIKDAGSPYRHPSPADSAMLQMAVDYVYDQFVEAVVEGRRLERDSVLKIADGSIFAGQQALELGLVDTLGGLERALDYVGERAGIKGKIKRIRLREKQQRNILDFLGYLAEKYAGTGTGSGPQFMYLFR